MFNFPSSGRLDAGALDVDDQALGYEIVLYDRKRGRALHESKLPFETFFGGQVTLKRLAEPIRFDPNTDLEPRIFVTWPQFNQANAGSYGNPATHVYNTNMTWWLVIMFKGRLILEA